MQYERSLFQKVRFCSNLALIYIFSIAFVAYAIHPTTAYQLVDVTKVSSNTYRKISPSFPIISGLPNRIVIPDSSYAGTVVDLPVDPGYYDPASATWTLSGYRAQFAMSSSLANNYTGETYIYGHNNDYVFGALRHVTPAIGSTALVYTSNGHIFSYSFVSASNVAPDYTSVLNYKGPPIMTIQTCTGSFNEVRTLYYYNFQRVIK